MQPIFHGAILLTFVVAPPLCHHWAPFALDFEGSLHPRQMWCIGAVLRLARDGKMMMAFGLRHLRRPLDDVSLEDTKRRGGFQH